VAVKRSESPLCRDFDADRLSTAQPVTVSHYTGWVATTRCRVQWLVFGELTDDVIDMCADQSARAVN